MPQLRKAGINGKKIRSRRLRLLAYAGGNGQPPAFLFCA